MKPSIVGLAAYLLSNENEANQGMIARVRRRIEVNSDYDAGERFFAPLPPFTTEEQVADELYRTQVRMGLSVSDFCILDRLQQHAEQQKISKFDFNFYQKP